METIGSGAAFFDYDRDGWMDVYIVNGGHLPGYDSDEVPKNALYRNDGGSFSGVAEALGVADAGYGMGVNTGDYDNDGDADIFVTNFGANALYRNEGAEESWGYRDITAQTILGDDESW